MTPEDPFYPRKEPKQARSRFLVDAIVGAAGRVLPRLGLDELTTHQLAEAAGVSVGSLYQYFPSKEAIVGALIERRIEADVARFERVLEEARGLPAREVIERTVSDMVDLYRGAGPLYRAMLPLVARVRRHRYVRRFVEAAREQVRAELARRPDEVRKDDLALAVFVSGTALESILHAVVDERPELLEDPAFTRELVDLTVRYLTKDPS